MLNDTGTVEAVSGTPERSDDADTATTTYLLADPDMDTGLWVYRMTPPDAADQRPDGRSGAEEQLPAQRWVSEGGNPA